MTFQRLQTMLCCSSLACVLGPSRSEWQRAFTEKASQKGEFAFVPMRKEASVLSHV